MSGTVDRWAVVDEVLQKAEVLLVTLVPSPTLSSIPTSAPHPAPSGAPWKNDRLQAYQAVYQLCRSESGLADAWTRYAAVMTTWAERTLQDLKLDAAGVSPQSEPLRSPSELLAPTAVTSAPCSGDEGGEQQAGYEKLDQLADIIPRSRILAQRYQLYTSRVLKTLFLPLAQADAVRAAQLPRHIFKNQFREVVIAAYRYLVRHYRPPYSAQSPTAAGTAQFLASLSELRVFCENLGYTQLLEGVASHIASQYRQYAEREGASLRLALESCDRSPHDAILQARLLLTSVNEELVRVLGPSRAVVVNSVFRCCFLTTLVAASGSVIRSFFRHSNGSDPTAAVAAVRSPTAGAVAASPVGSSTSTSFELEELIALFASDDSCLQTIAAAISSAVHDELQEKAAVSDHRTKRPIDEDVETVSIVVRTVGVYKVAVVPAVRKYGAVSLLQAINDGVCRFIAPIEVTIGSAAAVLLHRWALAEGTSGAFPHDALEIVSLLRDKDIFVRCCMKQFAARVLNKAPAAGGGSLQGQGGQLDMGSHEVELMETLIRHLGRAAVAPLVTLLKSATDCVLTVGDGVAEGAAEGRNKAEMAPARILPKCLWASYLTEEMMVALLTTPQLQGMRHPLAPLAICLDEQYATQFPKRRLQWSLLSGTVVVRCKPGTHFTLTATCLPVLAAALLSFNENTQATETQLLALSGGVKLKPHLDHLMRGLCKYGVLQRVEGPAYKIVTAAPTTAGGVAGERSQRPSQVHRHVRLVPPFLLQGAPGSSGTTGGAEVAADILRQREKAIEAAIVRTLKARRSMGHLELEGDIARQLAPHFPLERPLLKKALTSLIDRDYISRDEPRCEDASAGECVYVYLA